MKRGYTIYKDGTLWQDNVVSLGSEFFLHNKEFRKNMYVYCHGPFGQGWYDGRIVLIKENKVPVEIRMLHMLLE